MKKLIIMSAIALNGLFALPANAQIRLHIGLGFAPHRAYYAEPVIAQEPVYNDQDNDFYYLPDVDAYYSVNEQCYYYFDGENWVPSAYLPGAYRDYDWSNAPRYEVRAIRPYLNDGFYRERYNGREMREWGHRNDNNHFDGAYEGRGFRSNEHNFDTRFNGSYNEHLNNRDYHNNDQHFGNGRREGYSQPEQHFDNVRREGYGRPEQHFESGRREGYGQPEQHFDNGRQRADAQYGQPNRENRADSQPRYNNEPGNGRLRADDHADRERRHFENVH